MVRTPQYRPFLSYITVDDIAAMASQLGSSVLLTQVVIESAYWLIPVHPQDCPLQATCGMVRFLLTQCSHSVFNQRQTFSMQWPMHSTGTFNRQAFHWCHYFTECCLFVHCGQRMQYLKIAIAPQTGRTYIPQCHA